MKRTISLISCLTVFILLASCDAPVEKEGEVVVKSETNKTDMSKVRAEIQAIENQWADALNKKDINALMTLYADDAISMQDGGPSLTGKAAIKADQEKGFAAPPRYASISFQTMDVYGTPDEVTEVGTSLEKDAAGKQTATGKYIAIFQKIDGQYKCIREIYNKDAK